MHSAPHLSLVPVSASEFLPISPHHLLTRPSSRGRPLTVVCHQLGGSVHAGPLICRSVPPPASKTLQACGACLLDFEPCDCVTHSNVRTLMLLINNFGMWDIFSSYNFHLSREQPPVGRMFPRTAAFGDNPSAIAHMLLLFTSGKASCWELIKQAGAQGPEASAGPCPF